MIMSGLPVMTVGLTAILLQITALRQLLAIFSGNELDIGITLSVWLTAVGIGSFTGTKIRLRHAFALSFIAVAIVLQPSFLFIRLIRSFFSLEFGETIPLTIIVFSTVIALLPLCTVIGFQFPLAVSYMKEKTAKVYSLESLGAFMGGVLFTFLLSGRLNASILLILISILNIVIASIILRKKFLTILLLVPVIFYLGIDKFTKISQLKGAEVIDRVESKYGEITVLKTREQLNVYSSGKFQFSYPDPQTEELRAHLSMTVHHFPSKILVIGGSPSVLREFLKYPLTKIDFVEIDPEMINVSLRLLTEEDRKILKDGRVRIITTDARKFIKATDVPEYNLVVLNLPEPSTANINRFYTIEFFKEAKAVLGKDGILCLTLPTSSGYIGRRMQIANGSIFNTIKNVFNHVEVSSEEYGYIFASNSPVNISPDKLDDRFSKRQIETVYYRSFIINDAFSPLKVNMVRERLGKSDTINSDLKPVAYLYNLMLWAEVHGGKILNYFLEFKGWQILIAVITAFLTITAILWRKKQAVYYSMFTTGYSVMAFSLIIILTYQASFGYVYEMIGLLTSTFMIGMALGAQIIKDVRRPIKWLQFFEAVIIILFISAPLFFKQEVYFYILSLLCGIIGGVQFITANLCRKELETTMVAGRLYAIDLAGSFLGAFLTSILLIPLLGIQNTLLSLVSIKGLSLIFLLSIRHEKY